MLLFTCYFLSFANYPEGPHCPYRDRHTIGSPMTSRLPRTCTPGGSEGCRRHPLSCLNSWGWRAMLPPISSTSWMTMTRVTAPASATWRLATIYPRSAPWWTLRDTHRRKQSPHRLTPHRTLVRRPPSSHESTARHYDNSGCISHRLRQRARCTTPRPVRVIR